MSRRSATQIEQDRTELLDFVTKEVFVRRPDWARASDIDALVSAGRIEKVVRKEYDRSIGFQANLFGGAAVMVRRRMYLRTPTERQVADGS